MSTRGTSNSLLQSLEAQFIQHCVLPDQTLFLRYMAAPWFRRSLLTLRDTVDVSGAGSASGRQLADHLARRGLVRAIGCPGPGEPDLYWLIPLGGVEGNHDALQVAAGLKEAGVLAHSSALVFHGLTQLRLPHRYVLTRSPPRARRSVPSAGSPSVPSARPPAQTPRPPPGHLWGTLGELELRSRRLTSTAFFGDRAYRSDGPTLRVFDLERTLLFCLTDPACNGGARGLMQAWERAGDRLRTQRVLQYLDRLDRDILWRRVGAIADRFGLEPIVDEARRRLPRLSGLDHPAGLVGPHPEGRAISPWNVAVPWSP